MAHPLFGPEVRLMLEEDDRAGMKAFCETLHPATVAEAIGSGLSAEEALDRLRLQAPDRETIYYVYVLDESRKLLGIVSLRDLILAPRTALLRDIMESELLAARVTDDRERVAREMARYDFLAMPVV